MSEILGRWSVGELLAVKWNDDMAKRFPNAEHACCRQEMRMGEHGAECFDPPHCMGWHCNRCGAPTNDQGNHSCPDRPAK